MFTERHFLYLFKDCYVCVRKRCLVRTDEVTFQCKVLRYFTRLKIHKCLLRLSTGSKLGCVQDPCHPLFAWTGCILISRTSSCLFKLYIVHL